jgi:predicted ATPase
MAQLQKITVKGYKSIRSLVDFELRSLNILIGANGAGKSNFISIFRFLASVTGDNFPVDLQKAGGPDVFLHYGRRTTQTLDLEVYFLPEHSGVSMISNGYRITLEPTQDNRFIFSREESWLNGMYGPTSYSLGSGHDLSHVTNDQIDRSKNVSRYVAQKLKIWRQYHFHDAGDTAAVKGIHQANDTLRLKPDAANLAAYLKHLKQTPLYESSYQRIVETIRLAAPFFGDFIFRDGADYVQLEWTERGQPDTPWKANVLSDGTLRFMCLATLLLQPDTLLPDTILIDEPELGLHPYAIDLLADMLKRAAETKQVIVSTQSAELLNAFQPEDVIVVDRKMDAVSSFSEFKRLASEDLKDWLEDYTLGELWKRNILGGRPRV